MGTLLLGEENRAAAWLLESVGSRSLPAVWVFHADSGMGKSALLEALVERFERRFGPRSAVLRDARQFAREFARAVQLQAAGDFLARYSGLALVALDDLETLDQSPAAQQQLIQLIDALDESGGTLAVTVDRPPERLANIDARLRSRLSGGLVAPLASPSGPVRRRLLDLWNQALRLGRGPEELDLLSSRVAGGARDLLLALLAPLPADEAEAEPPRLSKIARHTADAFRLSLADLKGPGRQRLRAEARGVAMYLARQMTGQSYASIGRYFGDRDHTTVRHQCQRIDEESRRRADLRETLARLRNTLERGDAKQRRGKPVEAVTTPGKRRDERNRLTTKGSLPSSAAQQTTNKAIDISSPTESE